MNERHIVNLLWADDECIGILNPLSWEIEENGFRLRRNTNYTDALELLKTENFQSLLVDIILPHSTGTGSGTLESNLGIELADFAARRGVRAISFLTVMLQSEVAEKLDALEKNYPQVRFAFFDKLMLLERNNIAELLEFLRQDGD